jgi:hypothetical protein
MNGKFFGGPLDGLEVEIHQCLPGWFVPLLDEDGKMRRHAIYSLNNVDGDTATYLFLVTEKV